MINGRLNRVNVNSCFSTIIITDRLLTVKVFTNQTAGYYDLCV